MIEIRIHGRGGQGAVIASQILAEAAFRGGMHVQAFPAFGSERRGAPVTAFLRLGSQPILVRSEVYRPDGLIILDQNLLAMEGTDICKGLKPGGWILLNTSKSPAEFPDLQQFLVATVDASAIGRRHGLGTPTSPIVNTAITGAFVAFTGIGDLDNLSEAIHGAVPLRHEQNVAAAMDGAREVQRGKPALPFTAAEPVAMGASAPSRTLADLPVTPCADRPTTAIQTGAWKYIEPHYQDRLAPCALACPAGNDIPKVLSLLAGGDVSNAARLWRRSNPLPSTLGRVCPHFCEVPCNREDMGGAIAVHALERFLGDASLTDLDPPPQVKRSGHRVAVIGAGPAGIAAAYTLANGGHEVDVFDDKPAPGGYLRTGIPDYRLPKEILDAEIALVERAGVRFHSNTRVGRELTFSELRNGADAVIIAVGLHRSRPLGIPGSDHPRVYQGVELLERILAGERPSLPKTAAVVGGGNTAIDVARSLLRLGVTPTIVYRRTEAEMPAIRPEIEEAKEEGIAIRLLEAPVAVITEDDRVVALECRKMRLGDPDASGRRAPVPIAGSEFRLPVEAVVTAIGEAVDFDFVPAELRDNAARRQGVFVAGDAGTGEGTVAAAVGSGRRVAAVVNAYLGGNTAADEPALASLWGRELDTKRVADGDSLNTAYFTPRARPEIPRTPANGRPDSFAEVVRGLDTQAALDEARRCLSCGTCNGCFNCYYWCPDIAIHGSPQPGQMTIDMAHCKGCGICVEECPRAAMTLEEAQR